MAGLSVLLVNRRRAVVNTVTATQLLMFSVVHCHIPASHLRFLPFPFVASLFISVHSLSSFPLAGLISLPLEGPPPVLLVPLMASVIVAAHSGVELEGACAASTSDVLLGVTEVVMGTHLWRMQPWRWQPAQTLKGSLPPVCWKRKDRKNSISLGGLEVFYGQVLRKVLF